ncbi:MAG: hypothetical protein GY856_11520 [bacterium]|nr:hypothetical protein [bacterium]
MNQTRKFDSIPALVGMAILLSVPVAAIAGAAVSVGPTAVGFAIEGVNQRVVVTVSGPGDLIFKRTFEAGRTPSFELFDQAGNPYPDGGYTWELRAAPAKATETRDQDGRGIDQRARARALAWGYFTISDGGFVDPDLTEEVPDKGLLRDLPTKDLVHLDDVIIDGHACIGFDCVNGESFGFDTLRLKANNLRIKFQDTSNPPFPTNDWQLTANDSTNGGAERFSVDDVDGGQTPFTIEAGAPSHSLYVEDTGDIGVGTPVPVLDVHILRSNTPSLRLDQDGSSGFSPQVWDVAGNEANFFIRDATNGSKLPFRILPAAPSNSIYVDSAGNVGFGTSSPQDIVHVQGVSSANPGIRIVNPDADSEGWSFRVVDVDEFRISKQSVAGAELKLDASGNLTITGGLITGTAGSCTAGTPCDGMFHPDFEVESIEEHAGFMWKNSYLPGVGPTPADAPINITRKTTGILNELEKAHIYIEQLHNTIRELESRLDTIRELESRLEKLESSGEGP